MRGVSIEYSRLRRVCGPYAVRRAVSLIGYQIRRYLRIPTTLVRGFIRYSTVPRCLPSSFVREKPLQALKLTAVIGILAFGLTSYVGVLPEQGLTGLLSLAFFPIILAVIVGCEALLTGYRLAQAADPVARVTARRWWTVIRAIELTVVVFAPTTFYILIVQLGSEAAGPGAIGLLFIGVILGLSAYASVLLRTLAEYYFYRKRSAPSRTNERGGDVAE